MEECIGPDRLSCVVRELANVFETFYHGILGNIRTSYN